MDCAACQGAPSDGRAPCAGCGCPASFPLLGRLLDGRYRLVAPLGRGAMGSVYRAEHVTMKRAMAVKVLHPEHAAVDEFVLRFAREVQAGSRLDHPNIVRVTDGGRAADGTLYLTMELLAGRPLSAAMSRGRMDPERALRRMIEVLSALEHAHRQGVVHRDLKPDNVLLVDDHGAEMAKVIDFGAARSSPVVGSGVAVDPGITQAGMVLGTPAYIAPEQALGERVDGRADLYAAGVMLYEMLTGGLPFRAESGLEMVTLHLTRRPPAPSRRAPGAHFSTELDAAVLRALEKRPADRYASATEFRRRLERLLAERGLFAVAVARPAARRSRPRLAVAAKLRWLRLSLASLADAPERLGIASPGWAIAVAVFTVPLALVLILASLQGAGPKATSARAPVGQTRAGAKTRPAQSPAARENERSEKQNRPPSLQPAQRPPRQRALRKAKPSPMPDPDASPMPDPDER